MEYRFKPYVKSELIQNHLQMGGINAWGEKIDANSLYIMKDGKPWIGTMGEYHFSRADRVDWHTELCKMKAGGIGIVATYVFWIYHEEEEGIFDFSGNNDIRTFLEMARDTGLEICLRIGPWVNAECRNGGFPDWLLEKDCERRSNDPKYLKLVERYWRRMFEEVKGVDLLAIQIENELVENAAHIARLKQLALEIGFSAPLYTATGWHGNGGAKLPLDEVIPVFGGYPEAPWERHRNKLAPSTHFFFTKMRNDAAIGADLMVRPSDDGWELPYARYPFATCEMGGGVQIGHHRRPIIRPMEIYTLSLVKLGCGNNLIGYYMYHGGTNGIGKLSALNVKYCPVIEYDFQAPLSQYGEIREHYRMLNLLNLFAEDFGHVLAPMEMTEAEHFVPRDDTESLRYCMRTDGHGGFVFVNHYQRLDKLKDHHRVIFNTGSVVFPEMDVCGETCFFLPFNISLGNTMLEYATAQPVCRVGNTYFFVEIDGIKPVYKFQGCEAQTVQAGLRAALTHGDIRIVTLTWERACYARKLAGTLYVGATEAGAEDLYEDNGRIVTASGKKAYSCYVWQEDRFELITIDGPQAAETAQLTREGCDQPYDIPAVFNGYLNMNHTREVKWWKITVDAPHGFVEIPDLCDVAQVYVDGKLAADHFYFGESWRLPAKILYGHECYLAMSAFEDDFYREFTLDV